MEIFRLKISGKELLKNEDPKRVSDKVRAQWHFSATSKNVESPPFDEETLTKSRESRDQC